MSGTSSSPSSGKAASKGWLYQLKTRTGRFRLLGNKVFLISVFFPTLISVVYYGLIASDVYISESKYVVRTPQRQQQSTLGSLLQSGGIARAQDDAYAVHDFMLSRDALRALDDKLQVRQAFSRPDIDVFSRFGVTGNASFESLYKYYGKRVTVELDAATSITTVTVNAFTAKDAHDINLSLITMGETLVNQINDRARKDLVQFAMTEVADAENKAKSASLALASFRSDRSVFDPDRQSALQLQQVGKIQDELVATRVQLAQLTSLTPDNPQIPTLQRRVQTLESEVASEMAKVAGGGNSFSSKASEFERLSLERAFADRQLGSALSSLEAARNEARRKQLYLERVVQPNLPDYAVEPRRLRNILATFVVGLLVWGVLSMLVAGVREHKD